MSVIRIFHTKLFSKWFRKSGLNPEILLQAVMEMQAGLVDAQLGNGLVKKRVPSAGLGKRSAARVVVATYFHDRWFFIFGFSKNEKDNVDPVELKWLMRVARQLLHLTDEELNLVIAAKELYEIDLEKNQSHHSRNESHLRRP